MSGGDTPLPGEDALPLDRALCQRQPLSSTLKVRFSE